MLPCKTADIFFTGNELIELAEEMLVGSLLDETVLNGCGNRIRLIKGISDVIVQYIKHSDYLTLTIDPELPILGNAMTAESLAALFGEDFIDETWNTLKLAPSQSNWKIYFLSCLFYQKHCCDSDSYFDFKWISNLQSSMPQNFTLAELNFLISENQNIEITEKERRAGP